MRLGMRSALDGEKRDGSTDNSALDRERWIAETLKERLVYQSQSSERLETKAGVLAGFVTLASQFLVQRHAVVSPVWFWIAVAFYGMSLSGVVVTLLPRKISWPPEPSPFVKEARKKALFNSIEFLNDRRVAAFLHNAGLVKWKGRFWFAAVVFFAAATVVSVVGFLVGR